MRGSLRALFTLLGGLFGAALFSLLISHGAPILTQSAPGVYVGGGIGGGVGLLLALSVMCKMLQQDWLRRHGTRISARIIEVETRLARLPVTFGPQDDVRQLPSRYYVIVAEWRDPSTQQQYVFRSENLATPTHLARGDSIAV